MGSQETEGKLVSLDDLVSAHEIAGRMQVATTTVYAWAARYPHFPMPVKNLRVGKLWLWSEIERWDRDHPLPGR